MDMWISASFWGEAEQFRGEVSPAPPTLTLAKLIYYGMRTLYDKNFCGVKGYYI
jgi:hypothetical protein